MSDRTKNLGSLYDELIKTLRIKIADGSATAADLAVAQRILKDAGISQNVDPEAPILKLAEEFPFAARGDDPVRQAE